MKSGSTCSQMPTSASSDLITCERSTNNWESNLKGAEIPSAHFWSTTNQKYNRCQPSNRFTVPLAESRRTILKLTMASSYAPLAEPLIPESEVLITLFLLSVLTHTLPVLLVVLIHFTSGTRCLARKVLASTSRHFTVMKGSLNGCAKNLLYRTISGYASYKLRRVANMAPLEISLDQL